MHGSRARLYFWTDLGQNLYYYVKYLRTAWALCFCPAVNTEACPGEKQVLNFTTRPWQGPTRSFFYCGAFPELEMHELTSPAWCGGASRSNSALRNDPVPVPPSVADNLAPSSSDTLRAVLIVAVYRWRADRPGSTWSVPVPTRAIRSVTKLPCAVVEHGRSHGRAVLVRPRTAIPAIPWCRVASGCSSNASLG